MSKVSAWLLRPLEQHAKLGSRRLQFTLGDWICLFLMIQLWAAVVHSVLALTMSTTDYALFMDIYGWLLVVGIWLAAVWRLTATEVRNVWHRAGAILIVYPLAVIGPTVVPILFSSLLLACVATFYGEEYAAIIVALCAVSVLAILGLIAGAERFARRIAVATAAGPSETGQDDRPTGSGPDRQGQEHADPE